MLFVLFLFPTDGTLKPIHTLNPLFEISSQRTHKHNLYCEEKTILLYFNLEHDWIDAQSDNFYYYCILMAGF